MERISQLSQYYMSSIDHKRPASSTTWKATSHKEYNDIQRRGSIKSHELSSKIPSIYSKKEKEIADYLSNDMESDFNYRDEYEKLQESRGHIDKKKGVSINIKTKGTI